MSIARRYYAGLARRWSRAVDLMPYAFLMPVRPFVLVTGADKSHELSLRQFLESVALHAPHMRVIAYDLGLSSAGRNTLSRSFANIEVRRFEYERYPAYCDIRVNAGEFAWKPAILAEVMEEINAPLCWMDAGNILSSSLLWLRKIVRAGGFYSPRSQGTLRDWTHPGTLAYLKVDESLLSMPNVSGGCVAADPSVPCIRDLIRRWRDMALIHECIAPAGADRTNHRQDQSVLGVLVHQAGLVRYTPDWCVGFGMQCDVEGITRNAVCTRSMML